MNRQTRHQPNIRTIPVTSSLDPGLFVGVCLCVSADFFGSVMRVRELVIKMVAMVDGLVSVTPDCLVAKMQPLHLHVS